MNEFLYRKIPILYCGISTGVTKSQSSRAEIDYLRELCPLINDIVPVRLPRNEFLYRKIPILYCGISTGVTSPSLQELK